ncbi:MAG: hypothetical protein ACJAX4_000332 [Clostridium sp.]|jgi:hypothetical protein
MYKTMGSFCKMALVFPSYFLNSLHIGRRGVYNMNRTIVCKECDNNKVTIKKVGEQLFIKCSKCENMIMQTVHLESFNKNIANTYKLRLNMDDDRLMEADIIETSSNKLEYQNLPKEESKIRFMYLKEYEYIRQLDTDEYIDITKKFK